ncbi:MAG: hypothetical protein HOQ02_04875 [Lysobacter sp.]|nr:hypothetical protein [Lysobacter sp.]
MIRLLLAGLLAGAAFAASAQSAGVAVQPTVQDDLRTDVTTRDVRDHTCLRETGSLVTTAQNQRALRRARAQNQPTVEVKCADFGRAYTQDEIRRTGALNLADALRQLDPTVH